MSRTPELLWAQSQDKVFLTIQLPNAKNVRTNLETDGNFTFSATAGAENHVFELMLELFGNLNVEESKVNVGVRNVSCVLKKSESGWWHKLLRGDKKNPCNVKVDWDKWVDEDAGAPEAETDMGGMDFSNFGGGMGSLGGMGGLGGMEGMGSGMEGLSDSHDESEEEGPEVTKGIPEKDEDEGVSDEEKSVAEKS